MLLVKTKLCPSKINGIGVFANQDISQGTIVQKFIEGVDLEIAPEIVKALPELLKKICFIMRINIKSMVNIF